MLSLDRAINTLLDRAINPKVRTTKLKPVRANRRTMAIKIKLLVLFGFGICIVSTGCNYRPNFGPQGTIGMQRNRAMVHDPYPSNDLGPAIMGGRPIGYQRPSAETTLLQGSPYAPRSRRGAQYVPQNGF